MNGNITSDIDGCTALHKAANNGMINCVELLLDEGAKLDITDNEGIPALLVVLAA
jgi:ankyrin repeat protein